MNAILTLDYELYFGKRTGTPQKCLFEPTQALLCILNRLDIKATFFVDTAYLDTAGKIDKERADIDKIKQHLSMLSEQGHDIQLHLHPHWYYSLHANGHWKIDESKYKLSDLPHDEAVEVIKRGSNLILDISEGKPVAFRAGGWCIDGFPSLADTFYESGIRVDSTIYPGGYNQSLTQGYDFRSAPRLADWQFEDDPLQPARVGRFMELPISAFPIKPYFYWRRVIDKLLKTDTEASLGDGVPTKMSRSQLLYMLSFGATSVASIDGPKAALLPQALRYQSRCLGSSSSFVMLGHPKAFTRSGLQVLDQFLCDHREHLRFCSVEEWLAIKSGKSANTVS